MHGGGRPHCPCLGLDSDRQPTPSTTLLHVAANDPRLEALTSAPLIKGFVLEGLDPDTAAVASAGATSSAVASRSATPAKTGVAGSSAVAITSTGGATAGATALGEQLTETVQSSLAPGSGGGVGGAVKGREKLYAHHWFGLVRWETPYALESITTLA